MNIGRISPNFSGLMKFDEEKIAINTDHVIYIEDMSTKVKGIHDTNLYLTNHQKMRIPYTYDEVIAAYEKATSKPNKDIDEGRFFPG